MNATVAIFKREIKGYFGTPVAYVFLVVFLALSAYLSFRGNLYEARDANLRVFFQVLPGLFALLASAIAMRMWAEERRTGTIELLLTLPVTVWQAVLGKFLAGWTFFAIALLLTAPLTLTVAYLGDPDNGPVISGYVGALLMAGAYLAIGSFFSAITKNQVIAFIIGAVACGFFVFAGTPSMLNSIQAIGAPFSWLSSFVEAMSFLTHFDVMQRGVIEFRNLFFMIAVTAGFLIASAVILEDRKAR
jgi:ABC-2 type transport system permease protein